jgi:hypothetical protein
MTMLTGQSYRALVAQAFLWIFWLQKCLSTVVGVACLCGPVATHRRTGKSAGGPSSKELSRTSHLRALCGPLYHRVPSFISLPLCLNFEHFMICVL